MYLTVKILILYIGDHADEVNIGVSSVQGVFVLSYLVSIHKWSFCPISASIGAFVCAT